MTTKTIRSVHYGLIAVCAALCSSCDTTSNLLGYCGQHFLGPLPGLDNDPWTSISLVSFFSFSFFSSLHCAAMCGPLACAILSRGTPNDLGRTAVYNLGRGFSYISAGAILGSISESIRSAAPILGQIISLAAGVTVALYLVHALTERFQWLNNLRGPTRLITKILNVLPADRPYAVAFVLGLTTVLLPCMTLTPILAAAATAPTAVSGAVHMAVFFVGTVPIMLIAPIVPARLRAVLPMSVVRPLTLVFLALVAILTMARASAQLMHLLHN